MAGLMFVWLLTSSIVKSSVCQLVGTRPPNWSNKRFRASLPLWPRSRYSIHIVGRSLIILWLMTYWRASESPALLVKQVVLTTIPFWKYLSCFQNGICPPGNFPDARRISLKNQGLCPLVESPPHSQQPQLPNTYDQTFSHLEKTLYKICAKKCYLFNYSDKFAPA